MHAVGRLRGVEQVALVLADGAALAVLRLVPREPLPRQQARLGKAPPARRVGALEQPRVHAHDAVHTRSVCPRPHFLGRDRGEPRGGAVDGLVAAEHGRAEREVRAGAGAEEHDVREVRVRPERAREDPVERGGRVRDGRGERGLGREAVLDGDDDRVRRGDDALGDKARRGAARAVEHEAAAVEVHDDRRRERAVVQRPVHAHARRRAAHAVDVLHRVQRHIALVVPKAKVVLLLSCCFFSLSCVGACLCGRLGTLGTLGTLGGGAETRIGGGTRGGVRVGVERLGAVREHAVALKGVRADACVAVRGRLHPLGDARDDAHGERRLADGERRAPQQVLGRGAHEHGGDERRHERRGQPQVARGDAVVAVAGHAHALGLADAAAAQAHLLCGVLVKSKSLCFL